MFNLAFFQDSPKPNIFSRITSTFKSVFSGQEEQNDVPMEISAPYNFRHVQHVRVDPRSSTGFSVSDIPVFSFVFSKLFCLVI